MGKKKIKKHAAFQPTLFHFQINVDKSLSLEKGRKEKKQCKRAVVLDVTPGSSQQNWFSRTEREKKWMWRRRRVGDSHSDCLWWSGGICGLFVGPNHANLSLELEYCIDVYRVGLFPFQTFCLYLEIARWVGCENSVGGGWGLLEMTSSWLSEEKKPKYLLNLRTDVMQLLSICPDFSSNFFR